MVNSQSWSCKNDQQNLIRLVAAFFSNTLFTWILDITLLFFLLFFSFFIFLSPWSLLPGIYAGASTFLRHLTLGYPRAQSSDFLLFTYLYFQGDLLWSHGFQYTVYDT